MTSPAVAPTRPVAAELSPSDGLAQLAFLVHGTLERLVAEHDLSITQARLLGVLRDRTPTMNQLADLLSLDKSSITGLIDRAERRGLVARTPSTHDRRVIQVSLTNTGRTLVTQTANRFDKEIATILDSLPPGARRTLSTLITRVLAAQAATRGLDLFPNAETDPNQ